MSAGEPGTLTFRNHAMAAGFIAVPKWLFPLRMSLGAAAAYIAILGYAWQDGRCWPGEERLSTDLKLSTRALRDHIHELRDLGLITIRRRGLGKTNVYTLEEPPPEWQDSAGLDRPLAAGLERQNSVGPSDPDRNLASDLDRMPPSDNVDSGLLDSEDVDSIKRARSRDAPDHRVKDVMTNLEDERGYISEHYAAEAKAVKGLLKHGYTADEILGCYGEMKRQPFWQDKPLTMMSLAGQIGEWKQRQNGGNYGTDRRHPGQSRESERERIARIAEEAVTPEQRALWKRQQDLDGEWEAAVMAGADPATLPRLRAGVDG